MRCEMTTLNQPPATRVAIECLMLWIEHDRSAAAEHIAGVLHGSDGPGPDYVVAGLLNLNMLLGFELAKANGATDGPAWLRDYLARRSPELPE